MQLKDISNRARTAVRGFTIPEIMISSVIGLAVAGAIVVLTMETVWEQRRGMVDAALMRDAGVIQDQVTRWLRTMSRTDGVTFGDPDNEAPELFRRIVAAKGGFPDWPREELIFQSDAMTLIRDPDRARNGDEQVVFESSPVVKLRQIFFFPSMKEGGVPDASTVNVLLELDDDGLAGRRHPDGSPRRTEVIRTFSVSLRNK